MSGSRLIHVWIRDSKFEIENKIPKIGNMLSYPESVISNVERMIK
jgi:hypothetical protein